MTWTNRFRLVGGTLGILLIVAVLTLIFNQRQTNATSQTATIGASTYNVGATFSGTVTKQFVDTAALVEKGDKLCSVQSPSLRQEISNGLEVADSAAYEADEKTGTLTYLATASGELTNLACKLGTPVNSGVPFARISAADSRFIVARYELTPRDYARVQSGATASVLLPDNTSIEGIVTDIKVSTELNPATDEYSEPQTQIRIDAYELRTGLLGDLANPGTPVVATLELRDDGPLAGITDLTFDFLRQMGLK